jgi:hypothetical protein
MMNTVYRALGLVVLCVLGTSTPVLADDADVRAWIKHEADRCSQDTVLANVRVQCRYEQHYFPRGEAMQAMADRVKDHPDHPDKVLLAIYRKRQAGVPSAFVRTMWFSREKGWRLSEDQVSPEFPKDSIFDVATTQKSAFFLQRNSLSLLDPRDPQPAGRDPASWRGIGLRTAQVPLTGGLWLALYPNAIVKDIKVSGDDWTFRTEIPAGAIMAGRGWLVKGKWSAAERRGVVSELVLDSPLAGEERRVVRPSDWERNPSLDSSLAWMAKTVEIFDASDHLVEQFSIMDVSMVSDQQVATALAPPRESGGHWTDGFRGSLPITLIHDRHTGTSSVVTLQPSTTARPEQGPTCAL